MKRGILGSAALAMAAAAGIFAAGMPATTGPEPKPTGHKKGKDKSRRARATKRGRGYFYPEQSSRQALRGQRRAQGGPGIVLNPRTHEYEPRVTVEA